MRPWARLLADLRNALSAHAGEKGIKVFMKEIGLKESRQQSVRGKAALVAVITIAMIVPFASKVCRAQEVSVLHSFTGPKDGAYPDGILASDSAGNLYGTTQIGGVYGAGTIFELSPEPSGKWRFTLLYTFTGGADGASPLGSLVFDAAGNAYATVSSGGANGLGAVIELSPPVRGAGKTWTEKVLYSFAGGSDGAIPFGDVVFDAAGNIFGTTSIGGKTHIGCPPAKGCGTIYELSPAGGGVWNERVIHALTDAFHEGAEPRAGLVIDAAGNLYGTTYEGGDNLFCGGMGCGAVFELLPPLKGKHWRYKNLIDFTAINGAFVRGPLTRSANGALFGTTLFGGQHDAGVVYSFTQESGHWKFRVVYNFDGIDGLQPAGNLAFDKSGNLYGATYAGGTNDWGALFQLVPNGDVWTENVLYNFVVSGKKTGAGPLAGVTLDSAGDLYLTTNQGGDLQACQPNAGCGTVIKFSGQ
jgi:uncharacterized repeat protein (TIGR03803 family)